MQKNCIQPPTLDVESWRPNTKKLHLTNVGTSELKVRKLVKGPNTNFLRSIFHGAFKLGAQKPQKGQMNFFFTLDCKLSKTKVHN